MIARNTAFTYKGKNLDAKEIGKELGVRYVLEGSVQRDQNRVRVNAQLVDAETGAHPGPTVSRKTWPTCSSCKIRWWRDWQIAWATNSSRRKRKRAPVPKTPTRSISPCAAGPCCGNLRGGLRSKEGQKRCGASLFEQALKIDPKDADALAGEAYTYSYAT